MITAEKVLVHTETTVDGPGLKAFWPGFRGFGLKR
jgi:hypothetical protein